MPAGSVANLSIRDYGVDLDSTELSSVRTPSYQIDAANLATWLTGWGALKTALDAIILGVQHKEHIAIYDTLLSSAVPVSPFAQRELKILVTYVGNTTGKALQYEIPTPDLAALTLGAQDSIVLADAGVMAAYVTADEAIRRMPEDDAEEVTIQGARLVGRNI